MLSRRIRRSLPSAPVRPVIVALAVIAALSGAACHSITGTVGAYNTISTTFTVYPLRTAVPPYGSAINLYVPVVVQPSIATYSSSVGTSLVPNFDVAFNVDDAGHIVVLPPKLVVSALTPLRTAFQVSSTAYTSLGSAPGGTYQADSGVRVDVGQTLVVQAQGTACSAGTPFYAKLVIDSVGAGTGALFLRATIDQNCGYKSFASGQPTS